MDDETTGDSEADEGAPTGDPEPDPAHAEEPADPPRQSRAARVLRPWEALERLDRQWVDPTPLGKLPGPIAALALTTTDDPLGWDYLGAVTGALPREVGDACAAWLEAQLAADATMLGRTFRPTVELVPSGRLWYVVRSMADFIFVVDGPGFLSPLAAAIAASRRYLAELRRDHDLETKHAAAATAAEDEGSPEEAAPDGVGDGTTNPASGDPEGR